MILKSSRGLYCGVHIQRMDKKQSRHTIVPSINATFVKPVMVSVFFRGFDSTLFEALHCGREVTVVRDA